MTRNFALSKHRSAVTLLDFSLQCELEFVNLGQRAGRTEKKKSRPKHCTASESLLYTQKNAVKHTQKNAVKILCIHGFTAQRTPDASFRESDGHAYRRGSI